MALSKKLMTTGGSLFEGAPYFIAAYSGAGSDVAEFDHVKTDSENNIYAFGTYNTGTAKFFMLVKFDSNGVIQWEDYFSVGDTATNRMTANGITLDQNEDIHVLGRYWNGSYYAAYLRKVDSDGTFINDKYFSTSGASTYPAGIAYHYDSTNGDNVYPVGRTASGAIGSWDSWIARVPTDYSSATRRIFGTVTTDYFYDVISIGTNQVLGIGRFNNYPSGYSLFPDNSTTGSGYYTTIIGSGQDWRGGVTSVNNSRVMVCTSTSIGTIISYQATNLNTKYWLKYSDVGASNYCAGGIARKPTSDSFFIASYEKVNSADFYRTTIRNYDSSGNLGLARSFSGTEDIRFNGDSKNIAVDTNDDVIVVGFTQIPSGGARNSAFIAKVPSDGTLTGTYGDFTYSAVTVPNSNGSANTFSTGISQSTALSFGNTGYTTESGSLDRDFEDIT